jgi:hypothetical protein
MKGLNHVVSRVLLAAALLAAGAASVLAQSPIEANVCVRDDALPCWVENYTTTVQFPHLPLVIGFFGVIFVFLIVRVLIRTWDLIGV